MKLPTEITLYDDVAGSSRVRFDYDRGEQQWFDARAGVGSPGYDPSVSINEVNWGAGWESVEKFPQMDWVSLESEVLEQLIQMEADENAARDEAEYEARQDSMREERTRGAL